MLRFAPSVGTALKSLGRYLGLHDQGGATVFEKNGDVASLGYVIHQSGVDAREQIYDIAIAIAVNIMRDICGAAWRHGTCSAISGKTC